MDVVTASFFLMRSYYSRDVLCIEQALQNRQAELDRCLAALIVYLACGLWFIFFVHWVRPKNIIDQAVVVRFFASYDRIQLLKARELVRDAAVQCQILTVDTCSDR